MLKISKNLSKSTETKEQISDFLLTCNYRDTYKESSILFTVERRQSAFNLKYATVSFLLLILCAINFSKIIVFVSLLCLLLCFLVKFSFTVKKESVFLLVPVGLQLNSAFLLGPTTSTFIPWSIIQDFVIVEVITRQTVIYCLVVLVKDINGTRYVTIFEHTKPKLKVLEKVYKTLQTILISQRNT